MAFLQRLCGGGDRRGVTVAQGDEGAEILPCGKQKQLHAKHFELWKLDPANAKTIGACMHLFPSGVGAFNSQLVSAHRF